MEMYYFYRRTRPEVMNVLARPALPVENVPWYDERVHPFLADVSSQCLGSSTQIFSGCHYCSATRMLIGVRFDFFLGTRSTIEVAHFR